ncbi:MAG: hypothetical protein ACFFAM_15280 [Promethearchaeota archaeon]
MTWNLRLRKNTLFQPHCRRNPSKPRNFFRTRSSIIFILVFSFFFPPLLPGEDTNPEVFNGGRSRQYYIQTLFQTIDGGFVMAGDFIHYYSENLGRGYLWLMKIDANGIPLWNQVYDFDPHSAIIQTADGGFAIAGGHLLVRTDKNGVILWYQTFTDPADRTTDVTLVQTTDGGFAITGYDWPNDAGDVNEMWLVKTDSNGVTQWTQTYEKIDCNSAPSLVQTTDGGFAIASATDSFGVGGNDMWLVKIDLNGDFQWNQTYGGTDYDATTDLIQTKDGGFALAGATKGISHGICLHTSTWLVKTDPTGVIQWNQTYGEFGEEWSRIDVMVQTHDGGFAFEAGGLCLVKTDPSGIIQWNQSYGNMGDGTMTLTSNRDFALAGHIDSSEGGYDIYLVKTDESGVIQWNHTYRGDNLEILTVTQNNLIGSIAFTRIAVLFLVEGLIVVILVVGILSIKMVFLDL